MNLRRQLRLAGQVISALSTAHWLFTVGVGAVAAGAGWVAGLDAPYWLLIGGVALVLTGALLGWRDRDGADAADRTSPLDKAAGASTQLASAPETESAPRDWRNRTPGRRRPRLPDRHLDFIHSWPSREGMRRLADDGLADLSAAGARRLALQAAALERFLVTGSEEGVAGVPSDRPIQELRDAGLIHALGPPDREGQQLFALRGFKGRASARLLLATNPIPDKADEYFPWLPDARKSV